MDTKSLARSKRAHTQHHSKKSHSVHKPKAPGGVSENSGNPQGNQTAAPKTKSPVQSRRISALPSNWDRYDDDDEEVDSSSTSQSADVVVPKSKGADYMHLISEAQAEPQSKIDINSDCLSSLDDLLHDEFGSMISARGEGMLSWMEDDSFVVEEDGSATYHEPGFLSLNLNALEKSLEKVDLHERLYIDAHLLSLSTSQTKVSRDEEPCHSQTAQDTVTTRLKGPVIQQESSVLEAESLVQVKDIPILSDKSEKSSATEANLDLLLNSYIEEPNPVASASTSNQNPSLVKSSAFETELDSLLNSHSGAEAFNKPASQSDQKLHTTGFDHVLDDLLESSTSVSIKLKENQSSSFSSVGKSKVLDDFDSWLDTI